jgi:hypothetical protein
LLYFHYLTSVACIYSGIYLDLLNWFFIYVFALDECSLFISASHLM